MVVIIGDCHGEWHRSRHSDLGKGDHECFSSYRGNDMAHDAAFIARIRKVGDGMLGLICDGKRVALEDN